jgi:hypothetical protein
MAAPPRKRHLGAEQRRALQLLASSPFGAAEAIMFAHGFTRRMRAGLVRAGLAAPRNEVVNPSNQPIEVRCIRITNDGRRALGVDRAQALLSRWGTRC